MRLRFVLVRNHGGSPLFFLLGVKLLRSVNRALHIRIVALNNWGRLEIALVCIQLILRDQWVLMNRLAIGWVLGSGHQVDTLAEFS